MGKTDRQAPGSIQQLPATTKGGFFGRAYWYDSGRFGLHVIAVVEVEPGTHAVAMYMSMPQRLERFTLPGVPPLDSPDLLQRALDGYAFRHRLQEAPRMCGTCRAFADDPDHPICRVDGVKHSSLDRCVVWIPALPHT